MTDTAVAPWRGTRPEIPKEVLAPLLDELRSITDVARRLGETPRRVRWAMQRHELEVDLARKPGRPFTAQEVVRARILATDGQPATWIAEDIGRHPSKVFPMIADIRDHDDHVTEWQRVWPAIRKNPTLLELHYEFAPK